MLKLQFCVYVLLSRKDNKFYIGFTTNLKQRLTAHFSGQNPSTAPRRPFDLVFCEYYWSKEDCLRREQYFKSTAGKKALKIMLRDGISKKFGIDDTVAITDNVKNESGNIVVD